MVQYGRASRSSWKQSLWSSFGRTIMGKAIWENPIETWLGENSKLWMSLCTSWKRIILICVCGWHQIGWKETKSWSDVETINKEVDLGEPTSFLDHVFLGCTQRQSEISKDIVDNYKTMFESRISAGATEKLPCSENLRISSWSTLQSIYSMHRWPPLQRGRNKICWRIVKYMLSNCSEMLIFGKNWTTWYSMVSK